MVDPTNGRAPDELLIELEHQCRIAHSALAEMIQRERSPRGVQILLIRASMALRVVLDMLERERQMRRAHNAPGSPPIDLASFARALMYDTSASFKHRLAAQIALRNRMAAPRTAARRLFDLCAAVDVQIAQAGGSVREAAAHVSVSEDWRGLPAETIEACFGHYARALLALDGAAS